MNKFIITFAAFFTFNSMAMDVTVGEQNDNFFARLDGVSGDAKLLEQLAIGVLKPYLFYPQMHCNVAVENGGLKINCPDFFSAPFYRPVEGPNLIPSTLDQIKKALIKTFSSSDNV